jgi:DnaJ homolog subfamily C member 17
MATFGPVDKHSIVLSIKPPKKAAHKPPKYATAAVPFKTVADAHAAVCASGRADRGLEDFEINWMGGCEPAVWSWSERMLRLKEEERRKAAAAAAAGEPKPKVTGEPTVTPAGGVGASQGGLAQTSGDHSVPNATSQFSSFPPSFVRISSPWFIVDLPDVFVDPAFFVFVFAFARTLVQSGVPPSLLSSTPQLSAPGIDFESAVLMRMRKAERERLEREIRESEASEA